VIICERPQEPTSTGEISIGIHLVWPNIYTNLNIAQNFREALLLKLVERFGIRPLPNTFAKVIDNSVFKGNL
jgi:hypothetical protein